MMNTNHLPNRKTIRLRDYDYSQNGAYFITVCTHGRNPVFGNPFQETEASKLCRDSMRQAVQSRSGVCVAAQVVMPDHYHAILFCLRAPEEQNGDMVYDIVRDFKRIFVDAYGMLVRQNVAPPYHKPFWQRSFYEHIIRDHDEYKAYLRYIRDNPVKWMYARRTEAEFQSPHPKQNKGQPSL